jgi:hypothetical protein
MFYIYINIYLFTKERRANVDFVLLGMLYMLYKTCRTAFASLARRNINIYIHEYQFLNTCIHLVNKHKYSFTKERQANVVFCPQIGVL